ncbi:oxidoreductase [Neptunomonas phycophila]|uniref:Oxidoreductase n=1 Tax=Neptunomonas phycophila TaxID=1572645 RepID=A0AAW7XFG2_9GAMM|nr:oxidoreductase [Neptunomonas phycophila]MDO6452307.1 oxidoreductase [Neptunomonas phycophila]
MTTKTIKTGIIGYGFSATTFHLPFITCSPDFELTAISSSQRDLVLKNHPKCSYYETPDALIGNSDIDLVIITAPNDTHYPLAKLALEHNKHVVIEKPFTTNVSDGEHLIALAAEKARVLSVYHNRRWDGDFLTVQKLINEGKFGQVKYFESHFDRFRPAVRQRWREQSPNGGGILFDLGPHLIDQALQLFGLPEAITAQCLIQRKGSTNVDFFNIVLHYPDKQAVLHSDLYSAGANRRFTVKGELGSYEVYGLDPQEDRLKAGVKPKTPSWASVPSDEYGTFFSGTSQTHIKTETGGYQHYFTGLAKAIRQEDTAPISASVGLWTIKLIELAMQSSQQGRTLAVTS